MNNKGFTLVEILAVIAILGILTALAAVAYSQYIERAKDDAYIVLAKSAANAAEEYDMDYYGQTNVTIDDLVKFEYLENANDPGSKGYKCSGSVKIKHSTNAKGIDTSSFEVTLLCQSHQYKYCFPQNSRISVTESCS